MTTKPEVKHTPTPWTIRKAFAGQSGITGEKYYDYILEPLNALIERTKEIESVNAAHIVKCVNNFDALVETLKAIVDRIDGNFDSPSLMAMGPLETDEIADILKWANSAIAQAE